MADIKVAVIERGGVNLDNLEEIIVASDVILAAGLKNPVTLTFTDSVGNLTLSQIRDGLGSSSVAMTTENLTAGVNTITHGLNTRDVVVYLYDSANSYAKIDAEIKHSSLTAVTVSVAASYSGVRIIIFGANVTFAAVSGVFTDGGATSGVLYRTSANSFASSASATLSAGGVHSSTGYIDTTLTASKGLKTNGSKQIVSTVGDAISKHTQASATYTAGTSYTITHNLGSIEVDSYIISSSSKVIFDYSIVDANSIYFTPAITLTGKVIVYG